MHEKTEPRAVRLIISARGGAIAAVSGYLFGVLSFYTNFFDSVLQATAVLVDSLVALALIALAITGGFRRIWRTATRRRTAAGAVAVVVLLAAVNYYGVRPPGLVSAPSDESCVYDVTADGGVPIPLEPGGSLTQEIRPGTDRINSVSVIAGIDSATADPDRPHGLKLLVRTRSGRVNSSLARDNLVDNAFSRFEFPDALRVRPRESLVIQVINQSVEPVSLYVKQAGPTDMAGAATADVYVQGHAGNARGYRKRGYVLSGCVTRPGG